MTWAGRLRVWGLGQVDPVGEGEQLRRRHGSILVVIIREDQDQDPHGDEGNDGASADAWAEIAQTGTPPGRAPVYGRHTFRA